MITRRDRARAHAKHSHYCSCGKIVRGNGAKAAHAAMHKRKQSGGKWLTREGFYKLAHALTGSVAIR